MNEASPIDPLSEAALIWEGYRPTGLMELPRLAHLAGVGRVFLKTEGERPLGNFKALGGMVAGLRALARAAGKTTLRDLISNQVRRAPLPRLICASDGNHGLSVAAAASRAGAQATIYLPAGVARNRADRIEALGGKIVRVMGTYDDAVRRAATAATSGEGLLIPDTTSDPNDPVVRDVMAGYGLLTQELISQFSNEVEDRPSHMYIQAGVGGLAAAMADGFRSFMREPRRLMVVEPESAACVGPALVAGCPVQVSGDLRSSADMLSCGLASAAAIETLLRHDARAFVVSEDRLKAGITVLREAGGPDTTISGAAGLAGLLHAAVDPKLHAEHQLAANSVVLLVVTEGSVGAMANTVLVEDLDSQSPQY